MHELPASEVNQDIVEINQTDVPLKYKYFSVDDTHVSGESCDSRHGELFPVLYNGEFIDNGAAVVLDRGADFEGVGDGDGHSDEFERIHQLEVTLWVVWLYGNGEFDEEKGENCFGKFNVHFELINFGVG